ncbi:ROK family protein [Alkalimonas amylolytica]|uniref:N-acetylglucosamine kinase n=1 Tax=Alkalimonas amylolytica TaxID=152573 RepID=A0A1H4BEJ3_ALKAM|nr:ROK family protein [Alkalimonas amylolytica]SEA46516.1 N-acetylglucosamine kinase [Alkalimonas amylolytica]
MVMKLCYGLDIGGTKMELAIFDQQMQLQQEWRLATPTRDYADFLQQICQQITKADQFSGQLGQLGIALPGIQDGTGRVISSNVPCLNGQQVAADLQQQLQRPVAIGNDCRCFVLSEAVLGAGRGFDRVLGVILGTGCGGGFYADGSMQQGAQQLVGEFGHQSLAARVIQQYQLPLYPCGCGLTGCAETYVSGRGLERLYQHFAGEPKSTYQWLEDYRAGEPAAVDTFVAYTDALGSVLAAQVLAYDPDVLVLGGGLSDIAEIVAAAQATQAHLFAGVRVPPIKVAEGGAASGKRGAALLGAKLND